MVTDGDQLIYLCPSKRRHISEGCHDTTDSTVGEFTINFRPKMLNAQRNFALIRTRGGPSAYAFVWKSIRQCGSSWRRRYQEMFTVLSENLPENTKSGLKKKSKKPAANPEVTKLKKEQQKLERAMERLKRLYMYSEDSISEQEYITERNRISEAYEDIEMRLSEISTCERTQKIYNRSRLYPSSYRFHYFKKTLRQFVHKLSPFGSKYRCANLEGFLQFHHRQHHYQFRRTDR